MKLTQEQKTQIENIYHKYFKGSMVKYWSYEDTPYMWVRFYLANNEQELAYGYWDNDCFNIDFEINTCYEGLELNARRHDYLIKPIYNKYNAYDRRDISYRQVKGNFEKLLAALDRFFKKLHDQFIEDLDNNIITNHDYGQATHYQIGKLRVIR